ncbi:MAG: Holliday junction branch migration protein RuvA [bacterium]
MINFIRGTLDEKALNSVIIEAGGIGYQVFVPTSTYEKLPVIGEDVKLYIAESTAMYGGSTMFYGFLTREEREVFQRIRSVSKIGAKGALDILSKISKSLPDFKKAIEEKDTKLLEKLFGITKKTAEKLVVGLKDKIKDISIKGEQKFRIKEIEEITDAISGLVALGYRKTLAKEAVNCACDVLKEKVSTEGLIKEALRYL